MKFSSEVVRKPEVNEINLELERLKGIIEVIENEISDDEGEESSGFKDHEYSDESISVEQLDQVNDIPLPHKSIHSSEMSLEKSLDDPPPMVNLKKHSR